MLVASVLIALTRSSMIDDAFISFRYADNLAAGKGLVLNPGQRVEGISNLLWTVSLGGTEFALGVSPTRASIVFAVAFVMATAMLVRSSPWVARDGLLWPWRRVSR